MQNVLVTGGSGSFGNACIRQLLDMGVPRVVCFSRDELKQSQMAERFNHDSRLRFFLGDVRDVTRLEQAFHGVDVVVHAAALKRVDAVAYDSEEAVKTNVHGTANVIHAAIEQGVGRVVVLSSDKASRATNFYGATKFLAEHMAVSANTYGYPRGTRIACTRYGNVMGSRGSVLHLWRDSIASGQPLRLTHPDISRFWMSMGDAVDLVLLALDRMDGGEVFIPKLKALTLREMATILAGPGYPVDITGLRPGGEKLHEELLSPEEVSRTHDMGDVYVIAPSIAHWRSETPDYGPLVSPDFAYSSETAERPSPMAMLAMMEAA